MSERRCPACDRVLVQGHDKGETAYEFRNRKTCGPECFAKQARDRGRQRVDAKGELEHEETVRRTLEMRAQKRAELEADGCVFEDHLR